MVSNAALAATLRAQVAEDGRPAYVIAAEIGVHPSRLSQYLRGHLPVPPAIVTKIRQVVKAEAAAR